MNKAARKALLAARHKVDVAVGYLAAGEDYLPVAYDAAKKAQQILYGIALPAVARERKTGECRACAERAARVDVEHGRRRPRRIDLR